MSAVQPPNVVFIMSDQHRWDCAGYAGNPIVRTPNMDRLAAEGMAFTHAGCAAPVCAPVRQTLLTGQWPVTHGGVTLYNLSEVKTSAPLSSDFFTRRLRDAGYTLGHTGVWHVASGYGPRDVGYQETLRPEDYRKGPKPEYRHSEKMPFPPALPEETGESVDDCRAALMTDAAIDFLTRRADDKSPFFFSLHIRDPHPPYNLPAEYFRMYDPADVPPWPNFADDLSGKPLMHGRLRRVWGLEDVGWDDYWARQVAAYYGAVSLVDAQVGRVLDALDRLGIAEETMVIYTTDHGDLTGAHGMFDKHCVMYEEAVRVPLVVRWPGLTPPGRRCDAFSSHFLDLPATFLEIVEGGVPDGYEGESLLTLLQGGEDDSPYRDRLLSAYHGGQFGLYSQRMLRERDWKYVWNPTDKDELYDLGNDPGELTNLVDAPAHAERLGSMRPRLYEEFKALRDPLMKTHWVEHMLLDGVQ